MKDISQKAKFVMCVERRIFAVARVVRGVISVDAQLRGCESTFERNALGIGPCKNIGRRWGRNSFISNIGKE